LLLLAENLLSAAILHDHLGPGRVGSYISKLTVPARPRNNEASPGSPEPERISQQWPGSPVGLGPAIPDANTGPSLYDEIMNRQGPAIIGQVRTGDCGLNRYLHRFSLRSSSYYRYGHRKETVEHYLVEFRDYRD
jgi:hypothetical protein